MFCETRLPVPAPNQYAVICAPCRAQAYATADRLFKMREDNVQILCGCDAATKCPQGRVGAERQCVINIPEDDLFRIVMELPEFKRRYNVSDDQTPEDFPSESDERTSNNLMRHQYRPLTDDEKANMIKIKDAGLDFVALLHSVGGTPQTLNDRPGGQGSRELSVSQTKIEEAVMWAVKHVTG